MSLKEIGLLALLALALTGCASAPTREPQPLITRILCLPMPSYSKEEQKKAAEELRGLPEGSELARMTIDYGAMRQANRACQDSQEPPV